MTTEERFQGRAQMESLSSGGMDLARTGDIKLEGRTITLVGGSYFPTRLRFQSEDLATRANFAFSVMKQCCDPTAATGF